MYKKITAVAMVAVLAAMTASATLIFSDDFESYAAADPAVMTPNWVWNGNGTPGNASRIFNTGNFGGTRLWIASGGNAALGTGIDSTATIAIVAGQDYDFAAALVTETSDASRTATGTYDITIGGASIIGGPQAFVASGDDSGGAGDNTYDEQMTTLSFNSGVNSGNAVISIAYNGTSDGAFVGIDNVTLDAVPEPATLGMVAVFGGAILLIRRKMMI